MTANKLYQIVIEKLPISEIHPLHKLILEESCENAINNSQNIEDKDTLIYAAQVGFLTGSSALKGTLKGTFESGNVEQITLNYRGGSFTIERNSPFVK
ncbi:hypothetical protein [Chryseobacterium sp. WX]|uniref:hypothetical protein n=1 Tax=Chryseobacterium sp. WX TaxID=3031803 RepID=UPI00240943EF|nr:hypothetical protein [Chryseobacterium sp. WX]WFB65504.1 hypothetical protein PZ898_12215 [Chryseobacterium sp. WX]